MLTNAYQAHKVEPRLFQEYLADDTSSLRTSVSVHSPEVSDFAEAGTVRVQGDLSSRVLRTEQDMQTIAGLRELAAYFIERDLGLELTPFENTRDDIGVVVAIFQDERPIATIRFVPVGHGVTAAERLRGDFDTAMLGDGGWEIGRVVMDPGNRNPELLFRCLSLSLITFLDVANARHFHATVTLPMARLWRHFAMSTAMKARGPSGPEYALIHGRVQDVARALNVAYPTTCHNDARHAEGADE